MTIFGRQGGPAVTAATDDLRMAWQAHREGRAGRRDALLTLAIAGAPPDAPWADRLRRRLVDHPFALYTDTAHALADPRFATLVARLRAHYPTARVRRLLDRSAAARGPYTGRRPLLGAIVDDLLAGTPRRRRPPADAPLALPPGVDPRLSTYQSVLISIAAVMALADAARADLGARAA